MAQNYLYAGVDLHKKYSYISVIDSDKNILFQDRVKNNKFAIQKALLQFNIPIKAAVESTFNSNWLVDTLREVCINTVISHSHKLKLISATAFKTDKIDSIKIAQLLESNMLPLSYIPNAYEMRIKDLIRFRYGLVNQRTSLKNKVQNILLRNCIFDQPYSHMFGKRGQKWMLGLESLKEHELELINHYLKLINVFTEQIDNQDKLINEIADTIPEAKRLKTVPGIGSLTAVTLIAEIGNVQRFKNSRHLSSYAGLVPSTKSSGDKTHQGRITKQGSGLIRHVLSEAVYHTIRKNRKLSEFYESKSRSIGKSKAKVACMRKLLSYVYIILKYDYNYNQLDVVKE